MRHFLLRLFQLICVLVMAAFIWGGWYLSQRGFTRKWRLYVTEELHRRGLDVTFSRLTFDPFRGLVARTVRIASSGDNSHQLATLDELVLDINIASLLQKKSFIEAMELRDADVTLPLENSSHKTLQITRLSARVLLPPHQIYISHASAHIFGVDCILSGRFINPQELSSSHTENAKKSQQGKDLYLQIEDAMEEIRWQGHSPRLEVRFTGDGAHPEDFSADLSFRSEGAKWRGCEWHEISLSASYARQELDLKELSARDSVGRLDVAGTFNNTSGHLDAHAQSSLDVAKIAAALGFSEALKDCRFTGPPELEISARGSLQSDDFRLMGSISVPEFGIRNVDFQQISGEFSWDGKRWYLRDVLLRNASGQLSLNALSQPENFRAQLESTLNPNALQPLLSGKPAAVLREWNFLQSPEIRLTAQGTTLSLNGVSLDGTIKLGRTRFRGAGINSLTADVHAAEGAITYDNLKLTRDEGTATGTFTYDFAKQEVRLKDVQTSLFPAEVIVWVDPRMLPNVTPYRFKTPPTLTINGLAQTDRDTRTQLEILVSAPRGMNYTFLGKELPLKDVSGRLFFTHGNLNLSKVNATLFNGQVNGGADISIDPSKPAYIAHLETSGIDFPTLTKLYFNYESSQGQMDGSCDFSGGRGDDLMALVANGSLCVMNGNVFAIPVFGPLSGLLNTILPGMGYNQAREATATFSINSGVIATNDFLVHGKSFDMLGDGTFDIARDAMDFNIRINAQGLTGRLLSPISRLFEYEGRGKLSKPVWKPKRLPSL